MAGTMLSAAQNLAAKGLWVFPCRAADKRPATARGLKDATTDAEIITRWWRDNPQFNIGIATGSVSRIFVVDIDGDDGEGELRKLEAAHGALPITVESLTGHGRHLYFAWPVDRPVRNSASRIGRGIDTRGDGGYVLAPPSLHPTGRRYSWSCDTGSAFSLAPAWLLDLLTTHRQTDLAATPSEAWVDLIRDGVGEGQRNNALARLCGHLLRKRVNALVVLQLASAFNDARCRPRLSAAEVLTIVNSVAGLELKRRGLEE